MGSDEEERSAKKGEGDSHCSFGLDLRDDPRCDCGVLHLCGSKIIFVVGDKTMNHRRINTPQDHHQTPLACCRRLNIALKVRTASVDTSWNCLSETFWYLCHFYWFLTICSTLHKRFKQKWLILLKYETLLLLLQSAACLWLKSLWVRNKNRKGLYKCPPPPN